MRLVPKWFRSLLAAMAVIWLLQTFVLKVYYIPSQSMEPTLSSGADSQDRILVNRMWLATSRIATGDIIVFERDSNWDGVELEQKPKFWRQLSEFSGLGPGLANKVVKRVIASGGQTTRCCNVEGQILVDNKPLFVDSLDWEFVIGKVDCSTIPRSRRCFDEITVPANSYLVLGDNRINSSDSLSNCFSSVSQSACIRFVSSQQVIGKVVAVIWPPQRLIAF